ncbi:conjugal transfer pilus assembly protein TraH [Shewanella sairae]|uniref:Conjugal transfer pilus assembly protein TraH n=1 Tax=Shewanella sairae TaxID=190310 RepID=A0ABQ4PQM7_9GAMM|nr:conjugal transfer protein TraH [Shewanella sairae]MCL1132088.1 conjugal transfer protein TraH [Shewanella sairae]GIU51138.1 conjugal transfer pilus assembly protein TraH [Shewanella sairae]
MKKTLLAVCLSTLCATAHADVNQDLNNFFNGLNYNANISNAHAYKSQSASYYTGGSAYIRTPVRDTQIMNISLPSISAGCGGIDMFAGGFSHINSDQLVAMGKNIIAGAIPFAVDLALQTWAPQVKNIKDRLEAIAQEINALSVNSCEAAQVGVSALAGFADVGNKQYICATMGTQNNQFADWAAAKNECGDEGEVDKQLDNAKGNADLKDLVKENRNIIWYSIMRNNFLASDPQLAEFFMSLSGTLIYDNNGDAKRFPSLITTDNNIINVMLAGGKIKAYRCDDRGKDKCLAPTKQDLTFSATSALRAKVETILRGIVARFKADQTLDANQQAFLEAVSLPVLRMMSTSLEAVQEPNITAYANLIATDLITDYLQNALTIVQASITSTGHDKTDIDTLYLVIERASEQLNGLRMGALQTLEAEEALVQSMRNMEQRIEGRFSATGRSNLLFNRGDNR